MRYETKRLVLSWSAGIIACLVIQIILEVICSAAGAVTYIDYVKPEVVYGPYGSSVEYGESTLLGLATMLLSILLGYRIGLAVYTRQLDGRVTYKGSIDFIAWVGGLILFCLSNLAYYLFSNWLDIDGGKSMNIGVELVTATVIIIACLKWRKKKLEGDQSK